MKSMVMLIPFSTALPAQNGYSEYAPRNPEMSHECRTDEMERLASEEQEDSTRKSDDEPDETDFSAVLGMFLGPAAPSEKSLQTKVTVSPNTSTIDAPVSDVTKTTIVVDAQSFPASGPMSTPTIPSGQKSPFSDQFSDSDTRSSVATTAALNPARSTDSEQPLTGHVETPLTSAGLEAANVKSGPTSDSRTDPDINSQLQKSTPYDPIPNAEDLRQQAVLLPNTNGGLQQLGVETNFLTATRPYESTKDADAVTQEIMNTLSRAIVSTAPARGQSGIGSVAATASGAGSSQGLNFARSGIAGIGSVNSLQTVMNTPDQLSQKTSNIQTPAIDSSRRETTDQLWIPRLRADTDGTLRQTASHEDDQPLNNPGHTSSGGSDGWRLSSSGAVTSTLPDLATSVASEMRQPLSSQVSRAVIEHLERQSTGESETLTVQLDPPDLGEMVIELSKSKDGLSVRVTAREAVTMDMLLARGSEIETQLRGEKMDLRSLEFLSPDMMSGGAFQGQSSQDPTSKSEQPAGTLRRISRKGAATQISAATARTGDSQHALTFRA